MTSQFSIQNARQGKPCQEWSWIHKHFGNVTAELTRSDGCIQLQLEMAGVEVVLQLEGVSDNSDMIRMTASELHQKASLGSVRGGVALKRLVVLQVLDVLFSACPTIRIIEVNDAMLAWLPNGILSDHRLSRSGFYQWPELWLAKGVEYPMAQQQVKSGEVRHPKRPSHPRGELYRRYLPSLKQTLSFRVIDPVQDLQTFHRWMNMPGIAPIWELGKPEAELQKYLVDRQSDPHIFSVIGCFDDEPFGYFEFYWAMEDRLGPYYDPLPFDRGVHLLVGNRRYLGAHHFKAWLLGLNHYLFLDDPRTQRVMGEPRADNKKLLRYLEYFPCYRKLKEFDFPHKRAALMECDRDRLFDGEVLS